MGRALTATNREIGPSFAAEITRACTTCTQFDVQSEASRAPYLLEIVQRAGLESEIVQAVLSTHKLESADHDRRHRQRILIEFARIGSQEAADAIYQDASGGDEYAQDLLAALGHSGMAWLAQRVLPTLQGSERHRATHWLSEAGCSEPSPDDTMIVMDIRAVAAGFE